MTTFLKELISEADDRWNEVDILIEKAKSYDEGSAEYNVLCRAANVLMVSHMEGFIKGLSKSLLDDLNRNLEFKEFPISVKMASVDAFYSIEMKDDKRYIELRNNLIKEFENTPQHKIPSNSFAFSGNGNRNPKPDIVKSVLTKFGVSDIFKNLHESVYDCVFQDSPRLVKRRLQHLHFIVDKVCDNFPYRVSLSERSNLKPTKYRGQTSWQDFLNNINYRRHQVVHGNSFDNNSTPNDLSSDIDKIRVFQLLVIYVTCSKLFPNV